jgi:transcriptional regulator
VYVPAHFQGGDSTWLCELIGDYPFGLLVTADGEFPRISHLPMVAQEREDGLWIVGHLARANPHARAVAGHAAATVVFAGPHAYVSASWYEYPYATVPTWNYEAAHLRGRLREFDAWSAVKLLSAKLEGSRIDGWDPERLAVDFRTTQLRAIVGFELRAESIDAKAKLSQNRTFADRLRVIRRLRESSNQVDRECGDAMAELLPES